MSIIFVLGLNNNCAVQVREMGIENETSLSNQTGKQTCTVRQVSRRKRVLHSKPVMVA